MDTSNEAKSSTFLFGFVFVLMAILMFFGRSITAELLSGGLLCAVTFGILGVGFMISGLIKSERNQD